MAADKTASHRPAPTASNPVPELTADVMAGVVADVREAVPRLTALRARGIRRSDVERWERVLNGAELVAADAATTQAAKERISEFFEDIEIAAAQFEAQAAREIAAAAQMVGRSGIPEWRAGLELLKNHEASRTNWREQRTVQVEHSGQVGMEHQLVRQLTDEQLLALASPELAAVVG